MANFTPLNGLKPMVKAYADDLAAIRSLNSDLQKKTASIAANRQYRQEFIAQEQGKAREATIQAVKEYFKKEDTATRFVSIAAQRPF